MTITRMRAGTRGNWATPPKLFERYHRRYRFTVDLAAEAWNAKLPTYYTIQDDALRQTWRGRGWCNPPYHELWRWLEKAYHAVLGRERTMELAGYLIPVRTDQDWFHEIVLPYARIEWIRGRVNMIPPPGWDGPSDTPAEASMFVVFEKRYHAKEFR